MISKLREYVDHLFGEAPQTKKTVELKEEILQNLTDKYNDLIAEGKSEESAYNIAAASVGDVSELIAELKANYSKACPYTPEELAKDKNRSAIIMTIAVMLYILCLTPVILFPDNNIAPVFMFLIIAVATGLIIYNSMTRIKNVGADETIVEEFKQWKQTNSSNAQAVKAISSIIWPITLVLYFVISFTTHAWHITWIIFLIAAAANAIVKAIFDLKR